MSREPQVIDLERQLTRLRSGNYIVNIPAKWRDWNLREANVPIHMFFSPISKGYLMIATSHLVEQKIDLKDFSVNLSRTKRLITEASRSRSIDQASFEDLLREQARFELVSLVMHGYSEASILYDEKDKQDFEKLFLNFKKMEKRLDRAVSLNGKHILKIDMDPVENTIIATIHERDKRDPLEFEYSELTRIMLTHHNDLFDKVIDCLGTKQSQETKYEHSVISEGSLDFLWFYYLRQLKKGVDVGLFSGTGLSGIHAVCLSMFSKMLEHNADSLVRILSLVDYLKKKAKEENDSEFVSQELSEFSTMLVQDLKTIRKECDALMGILIGTLMISVRGELPGESTKVHESIAQTIAFYHGRLVKEVGEVSESYVTQRNGKRSRELASVLFGKYEPFVNRVEKKYCGRGYSFVLSQVASEIRRIAKFPRNVAVTALAILTPIIHRR